MLVVNPLLSVPVSNDDIDATAAQNGDGKLLGLTRKLYNMIHVPQRHATNA